MKKTLFAIVCTLTIVACNNNQKADYSWLNQNEVKVAVDATFEPIICAVVY